MNCYDTEDRQIKMPKMTMSTLWSVFSQNIPRTRNNAEAWHKRPKRLIGASCIGLYHLIKEFQKERKNTEMMCELRKKQKTKNTSAERIVCELLY